MKLPSLKENQLLREVAAISEHKRKHLIACNKEKARALLAIISSPQVTSVIEKKNNVNF